MGFVDENNNSLINDEQKVRVTLSDRARIVMAEDMDVFQIPKAATFINTVFDNYKSEAKASITSYLEIKELELDSNLAALGLDPNTRKTLISRQQSAEKKQFKKSKAKYGPSNGGSKIYHINKDNVEYLTSDECRENEYYSHPGAYIRAVIEEYCALPFIKRERILKKQIYDIVEIACKEKRVLKIRANYYGKDQLFYVYPYKIVPDSFHTQSYLVCYSRKAEESKADKAVASFSMARLALPTMLKETFFLSHSDIKTIEEKLAERSAAYLVGESQKIKIRLTPKGKQSYHARLYSRPEMIKDDSAEDVYILNCTAQQCFNYFFSFGPDVEILEPRELRNRFIRTYQNACKNY